MSRRVICVLCALVWALTLAGCADPASSVPSGGGQTTSATPTGPINIGVEEADGVVVIDPTVTNQTVEWFGASGCWVSEVAKYLPEETLNYLADLLFDKEKGIGLTSWRYNIGAGGPMGGKGYTSVKETTCVQVAPGVYDLNRDAVAIKIMEKAVERGVEHITLFANSPPAYMTVSGQTNGAADGSCNLNPAYREEFVDYLVDITELLVQKGLPIDYLSPVNEPQWGWGSESTYSQEGCHYEPEEARELALMVAKELQARGLSVKVAFPETATWSKSDWTYGQIDALAQNAELAALVDHFCGHSYGANNGTRLALKTYMAKEGVEVPVRQTEWCSDREAALGAVELSRVIHEDLTMLDCVSWDFWVAMMTDKWSLIEIQAGRAYEISTRLYALGNYAKFITGYTRIECQTVNIDKEGKFFASAYVSPDGKQTVVVVTNDALKSRTVSFRGTRLTGHTATMYLTSVGNDLACKGTISADYGIEMPFHSVATFVFDTP